MAFTSYQEYITPQSVQLPHTLLSRQNFKLTSLFMTQCSLHQWFTTCVRVSTHHTFFFAIILVQDRSASVNHRFWIRLIIRVQCALHHQNDVNLKFCRDSTHSGVAHSWGVMYSWSYQEVYVLLIISIPYYTHWYSICGQHAVSFFLNSSAQHRENEAEPDSYALICKPFLAENGTSIMQVLWGNMWVVVVILF